MGADSEPGCREPVLAGVRDCLPACSASDLRNPAPPGWPWSLRVAGATSTWPAVEVYEAGVLLDVVSSTRLAACVLRGARTLRAGADCRAFAWGRLPLGGDLPAVEFSRGRHRAVRDRITPVIVTSWCWTASADGRYDAVTVRSDDLDVSRRVQVSRSCR